MLCEYEHEQNIQYGYLRTLHDKIKSPLLKLYLYTRDFRLLEYFTVESRFANTRKKLGKTSNESKCMVVLSEWTVQ